MISRDPLLGATIAMADGRLGETRERLLHADRDRVARLLAAEISERASYFESPVVTTTVQLVLTVSIDETHHFLFRLGSGEPLVEAGQESDAPVRITQDLAETLRAVYGTEAARHDSTREVWIMNEPGPERDGPEDPWKLTWRAASVAAGQILSAISQSEVNLGALARRSGSDKWGSHFYTSLYERHLCEYRDQRVNLLEIGVGGYENRNQGGESLEMWRAYFRRGLIHGLDVYDKSGLDGMRIKTIRGDQSDSAQLADIAAKIGPLDIVIDDGSHLSKDVLSSFKTLFPLLADGGMYVIEDLHTAYWPQWNGNIRDRNDPGTTTGFLKRLVDALHHQEQVDESSSLPLPADIERGVRAIHLYHNIVFIEKGMNAEQGAPAWVRSGRG